VVEVFAVQDEITAAVTVAILPIVTDAEQQRALRKQPENLGAWEAYQRGLWHLSKGTEADNTRAAAFFVHSIERDSLFAAPHAMLAFSYLQRPLYGSSITECVERAGPEALRASELDPDDSNVLSVLSWVAFSSGDHESALRQADRAIAANYGDGHAHFTKGHALVFARKHAEGRQALHIALRFCPRGPVSITTQTVMAVGDYLEGNYGAAAASFKLLCRAHPNLPNVHRWLAASLGQLNLADEANKALHNAMMLSPTGFDTFVRSRPPHFYPQDDEHMLEGLRKAGWQG
jgi:adenylate cyclase